MRVGFINPFLAQDFSGANYFRNLLSCYRKYPDPELTLVAFTNDPESEKHYQCDAIEVRPWPVRKPLPRNLPRRVAGRLLGYDPVFFRALERQHLDLLSHRGLGGQRKIKTLLWQADFQHKALPEFFSAADREGRDAYVESTLQWGNILLSSHAAARDFRKYYPELTSVRAHVLHFSGAAALNYVPLSRDQLALRYPVCAPYFFLPNQFWKHKNHGVVVDALRQLPDEFRVICTGPMQDYRHPTYAQELLAGVRKSGLDSRFICLGIVPYEDLVSLMHHALAVLQPSFFEGWSTSIEEAKAMRKQIILSNLDVHIEQAPERGLFFHPDSSTELAAQMRRTFVEFDSAKEASFAARRAELKAVAEKEWVGQFAAILKQVA